MIVGFTGRVGQGKTMLAVQEVIRVARIRKAIIASNVEVRWEGEYRRLAVAENGLAEVAPLLEEARERKVGVVVFVDEIGIVLPARFWATNTAIDLMWACSQSRKLGADLFFTCQHISQLDAFLRRICDYVWAVWAYPAPTLMRREKGKRPWFFRLTRWDVFDMDSMRPEKRLGAEWRRYRRAWESAYDTDELVKPPSHLRDQKVRRGASPEVKEPTTGTGSPSRARSATESTDPPGPPPDRRGGGAEGSVGLTLYGGSGPVDAAEQAGEAAGEWVPWELPPRPASLEQRT